MDYSKSAVRLQLLNNPSRNTLIEILNDLDAIGGSGEQTNAWKALAVFECPFVNLEQYPLSVSNVLHGEAGTKDADKAMSTLKELVDMETLEEHVYLHLAYHYLSIEMDISSARAILRKGIKLLSDSALLRIMYCMNLAFSSSNRTTIEQHLRPLLDNPGSTPGVLKTVVNLLYTYYISICEWGVVSEIRSRYSDMILVDSLLSVLAECVVSETEWRDPFVRLVNWFDYRKRSFYAIGSMVQDEDVLFFEQSLFLPTLFLEWRNKPEQFPESIGKMERKYEHLAIETSLYEFENEALRTLLTAIATRDEYASDRTFWTLMAVQATPDEKSLHPFLRDSLNDLIQEFKTSSLLFHHLQHVFWTGSKEMYGDHVVDLMYAYACHYLAFDSDQSDDDFDCCPTFIKSDRLCGPRPFPYFIDGFIKSISTKKYPYAFVEAVWVTVISPCITSSHIDWKTPSGSKIKQLLDLFASIISCHSLSWLAAEVHFQLSEYDQAIFYFQRLLASREHCFDAYVGMAAALDALGDPSSAYSFMLLAEQTGENLSPACKDLNRRILARVHFNARVESSPMELGNEFSPAQVKMEKVSAMRLRRLIATFALVEHFALPDKDYFKPLNALNYDWLPLTSEAVACNWYREGSAYFTCAKELRGAVLVDDETGEMYPNFYLLGLAPYIHPLNNSAVQLPILHDAIESKLTQLSVDEIQREIMPFLRDDLISYGLERFRAYPIDYCDIKHKHFVETAEHCLALHSLEICYGIYYHVIEDAAGRQREYVQTDTHAVYSALKMIRLRATKIKEDNWNVKPYVRSRHAAKESAVIQSLKSFGLIDTR